MLEIITIKNNVLLTAFSSHFFAELCFFSIPVFAPCARQINSA